MPPLFALDNIEYRREAFQLAIDRLHLDAGRLYALVGPNGAGKSTLLDILALLTPPDRGEIRFAGEAVVSAAERQRLRRQITLVEQRPFLFDTSVYQNLAFGLRLREVRGDLQRHRIAKALQALGLEGFAERPAQGLSGGEMQRVALARALVLKPRVLLLDEPTANLDRDVQPLLEKTLAALTADGVAVVLATHDPGQPRRLGAEIVQLQGGRLLSAENGSLLQNG
jgi:tungstate transport system ATP-binding protein